MTGQYKDTEPLDPIKTMGSAYKISSEHLKTQQIGTDTRDEEPIQEILQKFIFVKKCQNCEKIKNEAE